MSENLPEPEVTYSELLDELRERFPQISTEGVTTSEIARGCDVSQHTALIWLKSLSKDGYTVRVVRKRIRNFGGAYTTVSAYVVEKGVS
jgi:transposase